MSGGSTETNRGKSSSPRYYIKVLGKAIEIINAMGRLRAGARLSDIAEACHLDLATALRILHTLERHGWVAKDVRTKKFKLLVGSRQYRVGYAQLRGGLPFSDAVTHGLVEAARLALVELLPLDNEFDAAKAIEHARWMIREKVDFAIECQRHAKVAPILADMFAKARIPTLAIDIPQPGALYFGPNNYTTGLTLGETAASFVHKKWRGVLDQVLLLEAFAAGAHPHSRIAGFLEGLQGAVKGPGVSRVARRDGKGTVEDGYNAARKFFQEISPRKRVLIGAINDVTALGAVRATRELEREPYTGIVGYDLSPADRVLTEIKDAGSPLIATICTFPEEYGKKILSIILRWLRNEQVPPTTYTETALVVRENVDDFLVRTHLPL
jgi:ribose transport system substrate-binding protein